MYSVLLKRVQNVDYSFFNETFFFAFVRMNCVSVSVAGVRFTTRTFCNLFFLAWMPNPFSFPKHNSIKERKNLFPSLLPPVFVNT